MSFVVKKNKLYDLISQMEVATDSVIQGMQPKKVKSRVMNCKKGERIHDLEAVRRTADESYMLRIEIARLEQVLREVKKLKDKGVN